MSEDKSDAEGGKGEQPSEANAGTGEQPSTSEAEPGKGEQSENPPALVAGRAPPRLSSRAFVRRAVALIFANPRAALIALAGAAVPFMIMAADRRFSFSVPVGFVGCLIATYGILDLVGGFVADDKDVAARTDLSRIAPRLIELLASGVVLVASMRLAVAGVLPLPIVTAGVLVTASFVWTVVSTFRVGQGLGFWLHDETGKQRGLLARHGFWLVLLNALLYLPLLGSFSLSDPWETHYGEVAREMLARDDWISLWWAQDGWFWSKPVLDFWMQALFFSLLGVRYQPDQMLAAAADGRFPQPEWAARMPVFLLTVLGAYLLYKGVARVWGRRAGFLGGLVLTTTPYWYLISHQTMTDMPYVGPLAGAMGLLLLGFHTDPEARVKVYEIGIGRFKLRLSAFDLLFAVVILCVLPQILYLLSRNVVLQIEQRPFGFRPHPDEFFLGSGGGNCGLPGNEACRELQPVNRNIQPALGALIWIVVGGLLLYVNRDERRSQRLLFMGAWFLMALSAMAKGAPGLVLPMFVAAIYIGATKRWRDLARMELPSMVLIVLCLVLPWYVAMYMRHGQPFTDRLLFHDMYKRAFVHVHDTNVGDDTSFRFYVWQLGYGLFPWTGLAASGLVWWMRRGDESSDAKTDVAAFLGLWFVAAFSMFTISLTKFHHYIFPAVPPIAMLVGFLVDRSLGHEPLTSRARLPLYLFGMALGSALLIWGVSRWSGGDITGLVIDGKAPPPARIEGRGATIVGLLLLGLTFRFGARGSFRERPLTLASEAGSARYDAMMLALIGVVSAAAVVLAGRDMFTTVSGDIDGQARLAHLFTYNYRRPWPKSLDFNGVLLAFTVVATALCLLLAFRGARRHVAATFCVVAVIWCAWGVNVYHYKTAPHWGQRETVLAYYAHRSGPDEPLVSYQMNWKGENFYTGNRTPAFVASGQKFKDWVEDQKKRGVRVMYFTTEHGRVNGLKSEIGQHKKLDVLTTPELNNKFMIARAEF